MKKAIVIGAGIGGLASAIRLSAKGYDVEVFEANDYPGGKLSEIEHDGYRFDAGPSLFTMPSYVDELFELCGKDPRAHFNYQKLDVVCNYFYPDGTRLKAYADPMNFAKEAEKQLGVPAKKTLRHLKKSAFIHKHTAFLFLGRSLHKIKSYLDLKVFISFLNLPRMHVFFTMNRVNEKQLNNEKMVQLFNRYATYNGSSPYKAPGILNIIPHLEFSIGAYFPEGGMHTITSSLYDLARSQGVTFHFGQKVEEILTEQGRATGIRIGKQLIKGDEVVCNMDVVPAYRHLLPNAKKPEKTLKQERSSSALIFYWGIKKSFPELDLHNIFFSSDYSAEFSYLFERKEVYKDPTVYINITSKENKTDAPEGCENWFVMINVPHNDGQPWDGIIREARENILRKLSAQLSTDIATLIETENVLEPRTIESKTQSFKGALYGAASNDRMAAFFRHPNFSKEFDHLYFCGGSVHPGGGIPLALSSAKIVDSLIEPVKK